MSAKKAAEHRLLMRLQDDHGYMILEMPRVKDRRSIHFSGSVKTGKYRLTESRVMRLSVPTGSWLGQAADAALKKAEPRRRKDK